MHTTARTSEDLVGIVPHALGYTPERSLVAIIIATDSEGVSRCETTLRIDFDLETAAHIVRESGQRISRLITDACTPTGVFLVLYDEEYLGDDDLEIHRGLIRAAIDEIALALEGARVDTLGAWWVSENRFGRIDDPTDAGAPLEAAASSPCATELIAGGSNPVSGPTDLVVRPVSPEAWTEFRGADADDWLDPDASFDVLREAYPRLDALRRSDDDIDRAVLDEIMSPSMVLAIDSILSRKWSRDALEMILSFNHPDFAPAEVLRCRPGDLVVRARKHGSSPASALEIVGLSDRRPSPRDLRLATEFLERYLPWGHPLVRANAYAVIAWFEWASGGSTMAEQYALAALTIDDDHVMAGLVLRAVEAGYLPQWLRASRLGGGRMD